MVGEGFEDVAGHGTGEVSADEVVLLTFWFTFVNDVWTAGEVDDTAREGFVEWDGGLAEAGDTALIPECGFEDFAECDGGVFDGVVDVDVGVAVGLDRDVHERVTGERRQHVVVKRNSGGDVRFARSIEFDGDFDGGFGGDPFHGCFTGTDQLGAHGARFLHVLRQTRGTLALECSALHSFYEGQRLS